MKLVFIIFSALIFSLGQIPRILVYREITIHANDLLIGITFFIWLTQKILLKQKINLDKTSKKAFLFVAAAIFSLLVNSNKYSIEEILIGSLYILRWVCYFGIYLILSNEKDIFKINYAFYDKSINKNPTGSLFFVRVFMKKFYYFLYKKMKNKNLILEILIISIVWIALIGILQYLFFPDMTLMVKQKWDPHLYRLTAPFFDPGFTGAIIMVGLIMLIILNWENKNKVIFWLYFFLLYFAGALTYSRTTYLMFFVSFFLIGVIKKSKKFFIFITLLVILTFFILPKQKSYGTNLDRRETLIARIENWQKSIKIWALSPFFGNGFNTYRYLRIKLGYLPVEDIKSHSGAGVDNSFLFILTTTGIIGFFAYLNLIKEQFNKAKSNFKDPLKFAFFITLIGLVIHSLFSNTLFYPWIMEIIWIINGSLKENELKTNFRGNEKLLSVQ